VTEIEGLSPVKRALLERELRRRREASAAAGVAIPRRLDAQPAPLSFAQQRMWFLQQWQPEAPTFNGARAIRLRGALDRDALQAGLATVLERHESLRTVVAGVTEPTQQVLGSWSFALGTVLLSGVGEARRVEALAELLRELSREPFHLDRDLMLRATLIELAPEEHVLLIRMHHIAADAHSDSVLFTELSELYNAQRQGRAPQLPELPIQYSDFAVWQRDRLRGARLDELVAYWTAQLEDAPELLALPTDRPRPPVQRHQGTHLPVAVPRSLVEPLLVLGRDEGATFFITMLACFATLLYRISGEADIVVGSPIANRNNVELQGLIGFFTNTIALRTRLEGNPSFREVLRRARRSALGAYAHQDLPFEKVVEALRPRRDPGFNPVFQVNFRAQESRRPALRLDGIEAEPITIDIGFSRFDLALELELRPSGLVGYFEHDRDLFDPATIGELVSDLSALIAGVGADPDAPILTHALPHGRGSGRRRATGRVIGRRLAQ
jgi:Condensation domain